MKMCMRIGGGKHLSLKLKRFAVESAFRFLQVVLIVMLHYITLHYLH